MTMLNEKSRPRKEDICHKLCLVFRKGHESGRDWELSGTGGDGGGEGDCDSRHKMS